MYFFKDAIKAQKEKAAAKAAEDIIDVVGGGGMIPVIPVTEPSYDMLKQGE